MTGVDVLYVVEVWWKNRPRDGVSFEVARLAHREYEVQLRRRESGRGDRVTAVVFDELALELADPAVAARRVMVDLDEAVARLFESAAPWVVVGKPRKFGRGARAA